MNSTDEWGEIIKDAIKKIDERMKLYGKIEIDIRIIKYRLKEITT